MSAFDSDRRREQQYQVEATRKYVGTLQSVDRSAYSGNVSAYLLEACAEIERLRAKLLLLLEVAEAAE